LKKWFENILPNYDKNRVYVSDIKKIAQWYNTLHKFDLLVREEPEDEKEANDAPIVEESAPEKPEEKPAIKKKKASLPKNKTE